MRLSFHSPGVSGQHHVAQALEAFLGAHFGNLGVESLVIDGSLDIADDSYCQRQVDALWDEVKRFENPHRYYVDLSQKLWDTRSALLKKLSK